MRVTLHLLIGYLLLIAGTGLVNATPTSPLICDRPGSTSASQADTSINANSCTDFSYRYPNSPQPAAGTNNWLYGYYPGMLNPAAFNPMTQQVADSNGHFLGWWAVDFTRYWTALVSYCSHPIGMLPQHNAHH